MQVSCVPTQDLHWGHRGPCPSGFAFSHLRVQGNPGSGGLALSRRPAELHFMLELIQRWSARPLPGGGSAPWRKAGGKDESRRKEERQGRERRRSPGGL